MRFNDPSAGSPRFVRCARLTRRHGLAAGSIASAALQALEQIESLSSCRTPLGAGRLYLKPTDGAVDPLPFSL
jgi:hypothetical protein